MQNSSSCAWHLGGGGARAAARTMQTDPARNSSHTLERARNGGGSPILTVRCAEAGMVPSPGRHTVPGVRMFRTGDDPRFRLDARHLHKGLLSVGRPAFGAMISVPLPVALPHRLEAGHVLSIASRSHKGWQAQSVGTADNSEPLFARPRALTGPCVGKLRTQNECRAQLTRKSGVTSYAKGTMDGLGRHGFASV